ncbi:MAG: TlpA family protein disulfide reductase [Spirochaetia bacterium]
MLDRLGTILAFSVFFFAATSLPGLAHEGEQTVLSAMGFTPVGTPQEASDFSLTDLQGNSWGLASLHGKLVLLNFWATWCAPCRQEMPSLERPVREIHQSKRLSDPDRGRSGRFEDCRSFSEGQRLPLSRHSRLPRRGGSTLLRADHSPQRHHRRRWDYYRLQVGPYRLVISDGTQRDRNAPAHRSAL